MNLFNSKDEKEIVEFAVQRAKKRLEIRKRNEILEERNKLQFFVEHDSNPIHASHIQNILSRKFKEQRIDNSLESPI